MELASALKRDRIWVAGALALVIAVALAWLVGGAGMDAGGMERTAWTPHYVLVMFFMWWIMMAAMMLPSAAAVLLLVAALNRRAQPARLPYGSTGAFAAGYLFAWAVFSLVAVAAQWWLVSSDLLSTALHATDRFLAGAVLVAAGLWQFTPVKRVCLAHCRAPLRFLVAHRRAGDFGGVVTGIEHGTYCLGCCWLLMALLFVGGIMNLLWIVGIATYVAIEKLLPAGDRIGQWAGTVLVAGGIAWIVVGR